jgi:hypothetical protein
MEGLALLATLTQSPERITLFKGERSLNPSRQEKAKAVVSVLSFPLVSAILLSAREFFQILHHYCLSLKLTAFNYLLVLFHLS